MKRGLGNRVTASDVTYAVEFVFLLTISFSSAC
jgi:hypothetical protein